MKQVFILLFLLSLISCGTFSSGGGYGYNDGYIAPVTTPNTVWEERQNENIHEYAKIGKDIAQEIYSRTTYDYNYRTRMNGNKIGRAPQESPEPYPQKICTGYAIEFFVLFNGKMKKLNLYQNKRVKAMIYDEPNHWRNLIVDNIHKQAYLIEPQDGNIEIIDYDYLPTRPEDLYYHGKVIVIGRM